MKFHVVTLFPHIIETYVEESIVGRGQKNKKFSVASYQLRDFVKNKWGKADERPYGGGPGMVLQAEPVIKAVERIQKGKKKVKVILTAADGKVLTNAYARKLTKYEHVIIVCGRYEGIDARFASALRPEKISAGPYILTGGELPALAIIDATARQIEGVLGKSASLEENRVASSNVYTRPESIKVRDKTYRVPKVLLSGNHAHIEEWRRKRNSLGDKA